MKLTKSKLKQIIKEEINKTLNEDSVSHIEEVIKSLPGWLVGSTTSPQQKREILELVGDRLEEIYGDAAADFGY